jgi:hypothetical protein
MVFIKDRGDRSLLDVALNWKLLTLKLYRC